MWIDLDNIEIQEIRTNALIAQGNLLYDKEEYLDSIKYYNLALQLLNDQQHSQQEKTSQSYIEKPEENTDIYYFKSSIIGESKP